MSLVVDACEQAMLLGDHHEWTKYAANQLIIGRSTLWQAMCAEWVSHISKKEVQYIVDQVEDALG